MNDLIIGLGAGAAALLSIFTLIKTIIIPAYKFFKKLNTFFEYTTENYVNTLQLKIMAPYMPLEERVAAGYEYTEVMNLNGPVHIQYEVLQEEYKKIYGKNYIKENSK